MVDEIEILPEHYGEILRWLERALGKLNWNPYDARALPSHLGVPRTLLGLTLPEKCLTAWGS